MKTNLKILILFLSFASFVSKVNSQTQCGIYLNADDFSKNKVSHSDKHTRIKLHETFKKELVEVKCKDTTVTFKKKDVFGYCNREGQCFRFYQDDIFPILNPTESIILYKRTRGTGMKNDPVVDTYYFSKDAASPIQSLTLRNLEKAFSDDAAYLKLLEIHFSDDSNLLEFDNIHKKYKLNRLLELAKEGKVN